MKTVSVSLEDEEFAALEKLAASESGTVDQLLQQCARSLASAPDASQAARRAWDRRELTAYLRSLKTGLTVGERPTRQRTYHARSLPGY